MENTGKVLLPEGHEKPIWYVAIDGQKWIGPMSAAEVIAKISVGELSWAHFGWRQGQKDKNGNPEWRRLCDISVFKAAVPVSPGKKVPDAPEGRQGGRQEGRDGGRSAPPPAPTVTQWFLYYSDSQFGPFGQDEIDRFLKIGKIHGEVHAWREGLTGWQKIKSLSEFTETLEQNRAAREASAASQARAAGGARGASGASLERRKTPRFPLLARSVLASQGKVIFGMCRDVSIGGMQLLTSEIPGPAGTRIKLNISPPPGLESSETSGSGSIHSFVAEGIVVRELEDGKGFSFRFENLSAEGRKAIEAYVSQQA